MWSEVVQGDNRGEFIADPDLVREASQRLKAYTSDSLVIQAQVPYRYTVHTGTTTHIFATVKLRDIAYISLYCLVFEGQLGTWDYAIS